MSEKIKPCPWCGKGEAHHEGPNEYTDYHGERCYELLCNECGFGITGGSNTECVRAWNALPRPEPWLDAPDGPGWWWRNYASAGEVVPYKLEPEQMTLDIEKWPGKWQRAHVPPPPKE